MTSTAIGQVAVPLLVTILAEVLVAVCFRLENRAVAAVVAVNFVTNPVLTAFATSLYWLGAGYSYDTISGRISAATWTWPVLGVVEAIIIVVEWRLLVWVLRGTAGTSRRLLALAITMNVVSATLGTLAVRAIFRGIAG